VEIKCVKCNAAFEHSDSEAEWMRAKFGPEYKPPKLCPDCRKTRRDGKPREQQMNAPRAAVQVSIPDYHEEPESVPRRRRHRARRSTESEA